MPLRISKKAKVSNGGVTPTRKVCSSSDHRRFGGMMLLPGGNLFDLLAEGSPNYPIDPFWGRDAAPQRVYC